MLRRLKNYLEKRKKLKEIRQIVQETLRSITDQREHLELNYLLRDPNKERGKNK
jgi:hypothetical protein